VVQYQPAADASDKHNQEFHVYSSREREKL
jgi:hypothetical protein